MKEAMTVVALLRAARRRIVKGWTKGADARDRYDQRVNPSDVDAVKWCARGAITGFSNDRLHQRAMKLLDDACPNDPHDVVQMDIIEFNDSVAKRKSQVLAVYDKAIKAAGAA